MVQTLIISENFDGYKEMALLSKYGGGIGWDWNQIRALGGVIDDNHKSAGGRFHFKNLKMLHCC